MASVTKDVIKVAGYLRLCPRQEAGTKAANHTIYDDNKTERVLLVDAENAFNTNKKEYTSTSSQY